MERLYQKYMENLTAAHGLLKPRSEPNMSEEQSLQAIRDNAERPHEIHQLLYAYAQYQEDID